MPKRLFAAVSLACFSTGVLFADDAVPAKVQRAENVAIVLDCSATMAQPLVAGERDGEGKSRLTAARAAVMHLLNELSETGNHRVTLCLYGHRLASLDGVAKEETEYLSRFTSARLGEGLLAGEDVEILRSGELLEANHLTEIKTRLEAVKPWGDNPLFLSVCRVADLQPEGTDVANRRIVVITDGLDRAEMESAHTTLEDALKSLKDHPVPVEIISLENSKRRESAGSMLSQLAAKSGGHVREVGTAEELQEALERSIVREESFTAAPPARLAQVQAPPGENPPGEAQPAANDTAAPAGTSPSDSAAAEEPGDEGHKVRVSIKYYKELVRGAQVILRSVNGDTADAKYKGDGIYEFSNLQEGEYLLDIKAVIHNREYKTQRPAVVDGNPDAPLKFLISFE